MTRLQNMFNEIYIRDITRRNRIKNIGERENLLNILSSSIGSLTNPEKLRNTFKTMKKSKIISATIKKYPDCFEDSFKKIIVTKDVVQPHYDEYGILTVNIYDFLLDPK